MCVSQESVFSEDDCGKLKIKDSNHTSRSKQNTYHVVNKNIASSKVTNRRRRKRGCLPGASPSLGPLASLNITLGCLGHTQSEALATPYSIFHQILTQNLKTSQHKTSTKNLMSSVSRKQITTLRYCCELILYLYWCNIYCIPTSPWFIPPHY